MLYVLVPYLWIVREATRFDYLVSFSLAVLAAFGLDLVFSTVESLVWPELKKISLWIILGSMAAHVFPSCGLPLAAIGFTSQF